MAVWTNGTTIAYYQRQNPNYFKDIPNIPNVHQTLEDILQTPFTMDDLVKNDKLTKTGKSLKDLILEMEDEVLANAGVDVFEEVFKLIFAKLYDEQIGATEKDYNLVFRNSGQSDIQLKIKSKTSSARHAANGLACLLKMQNSSDSPAFVDLRLFARRRQIVQFQSRRSGRGFRVPDEQKQQG